jgi:alpha 1,3-glucosidase
MILTVGMSGLTLVGADVGGFFQNPSPELLVRWYEAGSFQPFFRAHAHIDTARREPWLFGEAVMAQLRDIVRTRYTYLPLWYTLFAAANATGVPAMRPLWLEYPGEPAARVLDDQWLVGDALLVKPVTVAGGEVVEVYFPGRHWWYRADTLALERRHISGPPGSLANVAAPLGRTPVFQRGGAIVPRQMRPRRSSAAQLGDPYTLVVTLDAEGSAAGHLYLDDGASHDFVRKGAFRLREFVYAGGAGAARHTLRSSTAAGGKAWAPENAVERVLVAGLRGRRPARVTAAGGASGSGNATAVDFSYEAEVDVLTLRRPGVKAAYDFEIVLEF